MISCDKGDVKIDGKEEDIPKELAHLLKYLIDRKILTLGFILSILAVVIETDID